MTLWKGNGAVLKSSWIGNGAILKSSSQWQLNKF